MLPKIKFIYTDRRYRIALVLTLVWIVASYNFGLAHAVPTVVAAVVAALSLDFAINKFARNLTYFPVSGLVSGLLVGLIIDPSSGYHVVVAAALLAVLSKHLISYLGPHIRNHIFNPAAFGIVVVSLFYGNQTAWWGVSWWPGIYLLLIPTAGYIIYKMGRGPLVLTFLAIYAAYRLILTGDPVSSLLSPLDATTIFFALVMLPEPQSSPATGVWKYGFGLLVGVILILTGRFQDLNLDPLLVSLLTATLISFIANKVNPKLLK